jgi:hypothetical protein
MSVAQLAVASRRSQRDPRRLGEATEPQCEAGPQRGAIVHIKRHPVDVVATRDVTGVGACSQPVDPED